MNRSQRTRPAWWAILFILPVLVLTVVCAPLPAQNVEICDNQVDDDGDNLTDCDDPDCQPGEYLDGGTLGNSSSFGITLGDLDNDGDLDAFVANHVGQPNRVWINDGSGAFSDSGQLLGNSFSLDVALGDVDGDGDLDAYVANYSGQPNRVWLNDGLANFTSNGQSLGSFYSIDVSLADLDGDDDLDAFIVNQGGAGQPYRIWKNDGLGNFTDSGQALGNSESYGASLGDLDGDGDVDAFIANYGTSGEANRVWLNDGLGYFSDSGQALGNSRSFAATLGDLDGDGDLDAFVANVLL